MPTKMKKILKRYKSQDFLLFILYFLVFIAAFIASTSWSILVLGGLAFAISMMIIHGIFRKNLQTEPKDLIVTTVPRFALYLIATGFHFCIFIGCLVYISDKHVGALVISTLIGFSTLSVFCLFTLVSQTIIGNYFLVIRKHFFNYKRQSVFRLADIETVTVDYFKGLVVRFKNGKKVPISILDPMEFNHLPPPATPPKIKNFELLYRLKDEIERNRNNSDPIKEKQEELAIINVPFKPFGVVEFVISGAILWIILLGLVYRDHLDLTEKLRQSENSQELRYENISDAFAIFKGKEFDKLKDEWTQKCLAIGDHHCRLASYLEMMNKKNKKALELVKKSCSERDPMSCYSVFISDHASSEEKSSAAMILEHVCKDKALKNQTCCTCYAQAKADKN